MKDIPKLTFEQFAAKYCERQQSTPEKLKAIFLGQKEHYKPDGWMLLECQMMGGSRLGSFTVFPYGPNNTYKEIPNHPISPRGLASDMSIVVAILLAANIEA